MTEADEHAIRLAADLAAVAGRLRAGPDTPPGALNAARTAIAAALAGGQAIEQMRPRRLAALIRSRPRSTRRFLTAAQAALAAAPAVPQRVFIAPAAGPGSRSAIIRRPRWARGSHTTMVGPLLAGGVPVMVGIVSADPAAGGKKPVPGPGRKHLERRVVSVPVRRGDEVVAVVPLDASSLRDGSEFRLGKGSLWLQVRALTGDTDIDSDNYAGLRITDGPMTIDEAATLTEGTLVIGPGASVTLDLRLPASGRSARAHGEGGDAANLVVTLPDQAHITLERDRGVCRSLPDLQVSLWGQDATLSFTEAGFDYDGEDGSGVAVPATCSFDYLEAVQSEGSLARVGGAAPLTAGESGGVSCGWTIPVSSGNPDQLGEAEGTGSLLYRVGPGIAIDTRNSPLHLRNALILLWPGLIALQGRTSRTVTTRLELWRYPTERRRAAIDLRQERGGWVSLRISPGTEALTLTAEVAARLDRPRDATGTMLRLDGEAAAEWVATASGTTVAVAAAELFRPEQPFSLALDNALLRTHGAEYLFLRGAVAADGGVEEGVAGILFGLAGVALTLRDPYLSHRSWSWRADDAEDDQDVWARMVWGPSDPSGSLTFIPGDEPEDRDVDIFSAAPLVDLPADLAQPDEDGLAGEGLLPYGGFVLDVSGASGLFGVAFGRGLDLRLGRRALLAPVRGMTLVCPPAVSWEAVEVDGAYVGSDDDGPPCQVLVQSDAFVEIDPVVLAGAQVDASASGEPATATFSLPFGLTAEVTAVLDLPQTTFLTGGDAGRGDGSVSGALQLTLLPHSGSLGPHDQFEGHLNLFSAGDYGNVLPEPVREMLFSGGKPWKGVPLQRMDLSGYGASTFSDWRRKDEIPGAGLVQAVFHVSVGRAVREVLTVQSVIYPWGIRVKRTVSFERLANGTIVRTDSGWVAIGDGRFEDGVPDQMRPESGPISGVTRVQNIRDTGALSGTPDLMLGEVTFDGDLLMNPDLAVRAGGQKGDDSVTVAARRLRGLLQLRPLDAYLSAEQLVGFFAVWPIPPVPVDCTVDLGAENEGLVMRITSVEVVLAAGPQGPVFVPTVRGAPRLPGSGGWSMARRSSGAAAPEPLAPGAAVPLVRPTPGSAWLIAEPLFAFFPDSPEPSNVRYGLLQTTGTQRSFFESPRVDPGTTAVHLPEPPRLADVGALLKSTGIFPDLGATLAMPVNGLEAGGGTVGLPGNEVKWELANVPQVELVSLGGFAAVLAYEYQNHDGKKKPTTATFVLQPDGSWSLRLDPVSIRLMIPGVGADAETDPDPLLTVSGALCASSSRAPALEDVKVRYGGMLSPLQDIFQRLQELGSLLPGNSPPGLDVNFSEGRLTVLQEFSLPELPLGFGQITDVSVNLGAAVSLSPQGLEFLAGIGSPERPFHWIVFPLSGTGCLQVGVRDGELVFLIQAGLGLGIAISVAVASGSASIVLALQVNNKVRPVQVKAILTGQASVEVLGGVASASLVLSAAVGMVPMPGPPAIPTAITVSGEVGVSIHISICWVVDVDFDGSWHFEQQLAL